jgi:hypothetical protein
MWMPSVPVPVMLDMVTRRTFVETVETLTTPFAVPDLRSVTCAGLNEIVVAFA